MRVPALPELIETLLMVASVTMVVGICVPHALKAAGLVGFRNGVHGGPADLEPEGQGELYGRLYQQLLDLGFEPLGIYWEQVVGRQPSREHAFVHPQDRCQGIIFRLAGGDPRVVFKTVFTSGAVVKTCNYARPAQSADDYFVRGIPTQTLEPLLLQHRRQVARFVATGHSPQECDTLEAYALAETISFANPSVQRSYRSAECSILASQLVSLLTIPGILAFLAIANGSRLSFAWGFLFLKSVLLLAGQKKARRQATQQLTQQQEAADRGSDVTIH